MSGSPRIAIIGRGFSGAAAAAALLRRVRGPFSLVLIDEEHTLGGGLAYGKARASELLNVRARDLALLAAERGDFAEWLRSRLLTSNGNAGPFDLGQIFAPRALFRDYVRERLLAEMLRRPDVTAQLVDSRAYGLAHTGSGFSVAFDHGPPVAADIAILAVGYDGGARRRFGRDPFAPISDEELACAKEIILVGSGLTMVDALLRIRRQGCKARITIISRHGLLPRPQLPASPEASPNILPPASSLSEFVREVRAACRAAEARGQTWQGVVNGLRPVTQDLWLGLTLAEQRRFLRHLRSYWDIHRHRLPADIHAQVEHEITRTRTSLRAGCVMAVEGTAPSRVTVRWRGSPGAEALTADLVLDCSGHRPNLDAPLIKSAIGNGLASIDAHGLGLAVETNGRVRTKATDALYAIGPLCIGTLLEIGAAPEIAAQARDLAAAIAAEYADAGVSQERKAPAGRG